MRQCTPPCAAHARDHPPPSVSLVRGAEGASVTQGVEPHAPGPMERHADPYGMHLLMHRLTLPLLVYRAIAQDGAKVQACDEAEVRPTKVEKRRDIDRPGVSAVGILSASVSTVIDTIIESFTTITRQASPEFA